LSGSSCEANIVEVNIISRKPAVASSNWSLRTAKSLLHKAPIPANRRLHRDFLPVYEPQLSFGQLYFTRVYSSLSSCQVITRFLFTQSERSTFRSRYAVYPGQWKKYCKMKIRSLSSESHRSEFSQTTLACWWDYPTDSHVIFHQPGPESFQVN